MAIRNCYACRHDDKYVATIVPYDKDLYLLDNIVIGVTPDSVIYVFPDYKCFSVTTKSYEELHPDDKEYTYSNGTTQSSYLADVLSKFPLHSKEHITCVVNLFYEYSSNIITIYELIENK